MNTHLFPLALILLLLTDCSTKKEAPAPTQPRVTQINRMGQKHQAIRTVPVVSSSGTQRKATPDTATHTFYRGKGNVVPFILNMEDKEVIASCDRNRILYDEIMDAAFCIPVHSGIHISNFVKEWYQYQSTTLSTDTITPSIGMWVNMVSCSSGLVAGQILNPSLNHPISNDTTLNIMDVVITNIQGATGDSGGLVFHIRSKNMNLPNPYKPYTLGIHKGMLTTKTISGNDTTITREAMCIKATLINRILGLELY